MFKIIRTSAIAICLVVMGGVVLDEAVADDRKNTESILPATFLSSQIVGENLKHGEWSSIATGGTVRHRMGKQENWNLFKVGSIIGPKSQVETGMDGWALLARGQDRMVVGAGSVMMIPENTAPGITRIFQKIGNILFKVERKKGLQHLT